MSSNRNKLKLKTILYYLSQGRPVIGLHSFYLFRRYSIFCLYFITRYLAINVYHKSIGIYTIYNFSSFIVKKLFFFFNNLPI